MHIKYLYRLGFEGYTLLLVVASWDPYICSHRSWALFHIKYVRKKVKMVVWFFLFLEGGSIIWTSDVYILEECTCNNWLVGWHAEEHCQLPSRPQPLFAARLKTELSLQDAQMHCSYPTGIHGTSSTVGAGSGDRLSTFLFYLLLISIFYLYMLASLKIN
jgi:hypothetical protein